MFLDRLGRPSQGNHCLLNALDARICQPVQILNTAHLQQKKVLLGFKKDKTWWNPKSAQLTKIGKSTSKYCFVIAFTLRKRVCMSNILRNRACLSNILRNRVCLLNILRIGFACRIFWGIGFACEIFWGIGFACQIFWRIGSACQIFWGIGFACQIFLGIYWTHPLTALFARIRSFWALTTSAKAVLYFSVVSLQFSTNLLWRFFSFSTFSLPLSSSFFFSESACWRAMVEICQLKWK